ncbi:MAG: helix-turn-helix domain-containing protein [Oscillospiraceae bacterium]|jgi:hypothetical protein|nr:helix-turn-helix domain-containing protein [Oscillospiraceae bacterium]
MGLEYYGFAFFIFVLICAVVLLCNYLFSDVKRQHKLLDEKETKLLRLYQTIEDVLDEFYDSVEESKNEMKKTMLEIESLKEVRKKEQILSSPDAARDTAAGTRRRQTAPPERRTAPFRETADAPPVIDFKGILSGAEEETGKSAAESKNTHNSILELAEQGKARSQIAKELNITQSEVDLVIGINKN